MKSWRHGAARRTKKLRGGLHAKRNERQCSDELNRLDSR
jgi:hypothetical protein